MPQAYDVLIAGGGPAGLAAGIALASQGLRVLVCERRGLPADKPCGEGLMPAGVRRLQALGALEHLDPAGSHPFGGIRYLSPAGRPACGDFRTGPGLGIRRTALSAALLARAGQVPGLEVRQRAPLAGFCRAPGGILAQAAGEAVAARLLVGADGLHSAVRRWAGLERPGPLPPRSQRWGARQHFALPPWTDRVEVHWSAGLEAYVTPAGPTTVGVAFLWDRAAHARLPGGAGLLPGLVARFPALAARLEGVDPAGPPAAVGPLCQPTHAPIAGGAARPAIALVGDASGYLDAITGEGLSLAFGQALALAATAGPRLRAGRGPLTAADLAPYAAAHRRLYRPYARLARLALLLSRRPALCEAAVALFAAAPGVFSALLG